MSPEKIAAQPANHRYEPDRKLSENFLLLPETDLRDEILGNEVAMIEAGITPGPYFRFPGLVSDESIVNQVIDWGLVILGSDAWLAKGQTVVNGSIILIHGNKNEPVGESLFLESWRTWVDRFAPLFMVATGVR